PAASRLTHQRRPDSGHHRQCINAEQQAHCSHLRRPLSNQRTEEVLDKKALGSLFLIGTPGSKGRPAADALIRSQEERGSTLANWNVDENRQLPQFLYSFHNHFDALDG